MFKDDVGGTRPDGQKSSKMDTSVGGGSRPTTSKIGTPTSAPKNPHTLGRAPSSWLK